VVKTSLLLISLSLATVAVRAGEAQDPTAGGGSRRPPLPQPALTGADYRIGPEDQISVTVFPAPELSSIARVAPDGSVSLPLLGAVPAFGLSTAELERRIEEKLRAKYIKEPSVTVQVVEVRSRPVNVVGAVQRPGTQQVGGSVRLLDVLSAAGGITDDAGDTIVIRRPDDSAPIELPLRLLFESNDLALNVPVRPGDYVNVRSADLVYVVGAVNKPGAYRMRGNDHLTVIRAVALGEGLSRNAAESVVVVRTDQSGGRTEVKVDLARVMRGKSPDVPLQARDVLFVPVNGAKAITLGALDALVRIVTFRPY
jgi:polysaccharide biosynthesis/export protein